MNNKKVSVWKIVAVLLAIIFCFVLIFVGVKFVENHVIGKIDNDILSGLQGDDYDTLQYNGKKYKLKTRVETVLLIGLDNLGKIEDSNSYTNSQQADFLALLVIDKKAEKTTLIHINRDTMTDIPVLGVNGDKVGTMNSQIALAHTYGSGLDDSCRNTADAVSELLDVRIDSYVSLAMGAVGTLNDLVGGVQVELLEDFTQYDETMTKGKTLTLKGDQALYYVRSRMDVGDQTNLARMERQKQYINAYVTTFKEQYAQNNKLVLDAVESVDDYMVTDMTVQELNEMSQYITEYNLDEIVTPKGESVMGDAHIEHHIDQESLMDIIVSVFYDEVD